MAEKKKPEKKSRTSDGKKSKAGLIIVCALVCCLVGVPVAYYIGTSDSTVGEWQRVGITLCPTRAAELSSGEVEMLNSVLGARHLAEPMELHFEGERNASGGRGFNSLNNLNFSWTTQGGATRNDATTISIIDDTGRMTVMTHNISRFGNFPRMTLNLTVDGNEVREVWEFMRVRG